MFDTRNDLSPMTRRSVVEMLNRHLADAVDLQLQAKQAHWNVKGPSFVALHELFDRIADQARAYADDIAERAVALGGIARGTVQAVSQGSRLPIHPLTIGQWRATVRAMRDAIAAFGRAARHGIDEADGLGDTVTADLLTEISRGLDKSLWMVEAHLHGGAAAAVQEEEEPAA